MRNRPRSARRDAVTADSVSRRRALGLLAAAVAMAGGLRARSARAEGAGAEAPTVAVLYFDYEGKNAELEPLRKGLAQMLTTDLAELDTVRVVERARLEEVLAELALGRTAKVDRASAARVGKLLGAHLLVLGSFFEIAGALRVDARVVEAETGRVVKGAGVRGRSDDALACEATLAEKLRDGLAALAKVAPPARASEAPRGGASPKAAGASAAEGNARANAAAPVAERGPRREPNAAPGAKVHVSALAAYGRALDALDRQDKRVARTELEAAVRISPGFRLAAGDLARIAP
jgi:TolB-like protein